MLSILLLFNLCACGNSGQEDTDATGAETASVASKEASGPKTENDLSGDRPGDPPSGSGHDGAPPDAPGSGKPGGAPGSGSSTDIDYSGATEIASGENQSGQTYVSEASDESALLISTADEVTVTDPTVTKSGDSDGGDNCNFYGLNAAVLVKDGSTATSTGGTVTSDADGANGVFCCG